MKPISLNDGEWFDSHAAEAWPRSNAVGHDTITQARMVGGAKTRESPWRTRLGVFVLEREEYEASPARTTRRQVCNSKAVPWLIRWARLSLPPGGVDNEV